MAKRVVSQKEIAAGLDSIGAVDGLFGKPKKTRRDSPFRSTKIEEEETAEAAEPVSEPLRPAPTVQEGRVVAETAPASQPVAPKVVEREVSLQVSEPVSSPVQVKNPVREVAPKPEEKQRRVSVTKAQEFDERVTLPMSFEMREACEALAKQLQKRRTEKNERITSNTVMRCFLEACIQSFELEEHEFANNEEALCELVLSKLR